jgi:hypothetical protein
MLNVVMLSVIVVGVMAPISNVKIWPKENAQSLDILVQQKMFYNVETSQQNFPEKKIIFSPKMIVCMPIGCIFSCVQPLYE